MPRLYLLSATRLVDIPAEQAPRPGDVVALFRAGQNLNGSPSLTIVDANALVPPTESDALARQIQAGLHGWYREQERDPTACDWLSFGRTMTQHVVTGNSFIVLANVAVMFARLLPGVEAVYTDIQDGRFVYSTAPDHPEGLLWRTLLEDMARARGIAVVTIASQAVLPSMVVAERYRSVTGALRSIIGGLRPRQIVKRLRASADPSRSAIYFFSSSDRMPLIERLSQSGKVRAIASLALGHAVEEFRYDQIIPSSFTVVKAAWRTIRHVRRLRRSGWSCPALVVEGVDLTPYLLRVLTSRLSRDMPNLMVMAAQIERVAQVLRPRAFVVANDGYAFALILEQLRAKYSFSLYFVNHGYDFMPILRSSTPECDRQLITVAEGDSVAKLYGASLPESEKPRRPVVTATALASMADLRGKRPDNRRVLVTNYGALSPYTGRQDCYDEYLCGIAEAAKILRTRHDIEMAYRPHPAENRAMSEALFRLYGATDAVTLDDSPSFAAALARSGAYVCNVTTCYYQALYAGWPAIFFDPGFRRDSYIGLVADDDTGRPVAATAAELVALVAQAFEKDSPVASFPARLLRDFAPRYFGPGRDRPIAALAEFFEAEMDRT
jgi:hypothetical protein